MCLVGLITSPLLPLNVLNVALEIIYLLLTEFEGRTISYGPSFFPFAYGTSAKRAGQIDGKKHEDP